MNWRNAGICYAGNAQSQDRQTREPGTKDQAARNGNMPKEIITKDTTDRDERRREEIGKTKTGIAAQDI
jgi:hypothetical protein